MAPSSYQDVLKLAKDNKCEFIDLKFIDLPGTWQHYTLPIKELADLFENGNGFDGSSIRGFRAIHESDMLLFADPTTAIVDPILSPSTLSLICDVKDPVDGKDYDRDPRYVARKAEAYLKTTGIADTSFWGPELEFFIFNSIAFPTVMRVSIPSILRKVSGIPAIPPSPTWVIARVTKKVISLVLLPTRCMISGRR
jgi:Glutamine synthetase